MAVEKQESIIPEGATDERGIPRLLLRDWAGEEVKVTPYTASIGHPDEGEFFLMSWIEEKIWDKLTEKDKKKIEDGFEKFTLFLTKTIFGRRSREMDTMKDLLKEIRKKKKASKD